MKIKHLIEELGHFPPDAPVELTKIISAENDGEAYEIRLDFPIIGLAQAPDGDVLFVVAHDKTVAAFAKKEEGAIRRLDLPESES